MEKDVRKIKYDSNILETIDALALLGSVLTLPIGVYFFVALGADYIRTAKIKEIYSTGDYKGTTMSRTVYKLGHILRH